MEQNLTDIMDDMDYLDSDDTKENWLLQSKSHLQSLLNLHETYGDSIYFIYSKILSKAQKHWIAANANGGAKHLLTKNPNQ